MYDLSKFWKCGENVYVSENVEIKRPHLVWLESHIAIDSYFYCTTNMFVGNYVHIAPMVSIIGGADASFVMGNFTTIAIGCRIICATDEYLGEGLVSPVIPNQYRDRVINLPVTLEEYSALASNVVVIPGVTLGEGAVVGANSYVNRDIPAWEIWAGSPAKFIRKRKRDRMIKFGAEVLR